MSRGAVFFDVDGTLVTGTSSSAHLAGYLGHGETLRELDDAYVAGRLHNSEIAVHDARAYEGRTRADLLPWLRALPLIEGIAEVVEWCRRHELLPVLTTLAWEPVGQHLCRTFGFAQACGPRLAEDDGRFTGEVAAHLTPEGRRDFALAVCDREGLSAERAVAIGDSVSDLPLFREVGLAIALNASDAAKAAARVTVDADDLRTVLPVLSDWFSIEER